MSGNSGFNNNLDVLGNARVDGTLTVKGNVAVDSPSSFAGYGIIPIGGIVMFMSFAGMLIQRLEQAARFAVTPVQWRFWLAPDYHYFDFDSSYPLQCLCFAYDVAFDAMTDAEREEVRAAIATIAHGLYLNTLSGHGSIYNLSLLHI